MRGLNKRIPAPKYFHFESEVITFDTTETFFVVSAEMSVGFLEISGVVNF